MNKINKKIRIKDIATLAGVSEGTVDRVLHQRGDVSTKSRAAVEKVIQEKNYSPNLIARSLASKKQYLFICLIPFHFEADYWQNVEYGFKTSAKDYLHYNIHLEKYYFDQFDVNSFVNITSQIIERQPDAVVLAPIFREETIIFTNELKLKKIPFSFIDSMIEETDFTSYYGQNSFQSGYIAAKLLLNSLPDNAQIVIIRTKRKGAVSNQTIARKNGFMFYIQEKKLSNIELINVEMFDNDENTNLEILHNIFNENNNIKAAITFNSKVHRLAMHLHALNIKYVRLIGYDLLDENVRYLKNGVISYLIAQRPDKQAYFTVRDMCSKLIFKQEIKKLNYVPIDILMNENIDDYLQFRE